MTPVEPMAEPAADPLARVDTTHLIDALHMQLRTVWTRVGELQPRLRRDATAAASVLAFADVNSAASVLVARLDLVESRLAGRADHWRCVTAALRPLRRAMCEAFEQAHVYLALARTHVPDAPLMAQLNRLAGLLLLLEREPQRPPAGLLLLLEREPQRPPVLVLGERCDADIARWTQPSPDDRAHPNDDSRRRTRACDSLLGGVS